jgi:hypothetical protein
MGLIEVTINGAHPDELPFYFSQVVVQFNGCGWPSKLKKGYHMT